MRPFLLSALSALCFFSVDVSLVFAQSAGSSATPNKHVVFGTLADPANASRKRSSGAVRLEATKSSADKTVRDSSGRISKIYEPDASGKLSVETDFEYNAAGNIKEIKQLGGAGDPVRSRSFTYGADGSLASQTSPEQGKTLVTLDKSNFIQSTTDARGVTKNLFYDSQHRLVKKTYSDGSPAVHFSYRSKKQSMFVAIVGEKNGPDLQKVERYDKAGALASTLQRYSDGTYATARVTYDALGRIDRIVYPDNRVIRQGWTHKGHVAVLREGTISYFSNPRYAPGGNLVSANLGSDLKLRKGYDADGRVSELAVLKGEQALFGHRYHYNPYGSVDQLDDLAGSNAVDFTYDQLNRVSSFKDSAGVTRKFPYDAAGNLKSANGADGNDAVDAHNRLHSSAGLSYDNAGEMTFDGSHTYTYNADDLVSSVDGDKVRYVYNALGELIERSTRKGNEEFLWLNGQLLAVREVDGTWTDSLYLDGRRIASIRKPLATKQNPTPKDAVTYFVTDRVGMARAAVAADGTLLAAAVFSPFGEPMSDTPLAAAAESISYSGEVHDSYSGLNIYQYRSYNPRLGRWMSPDPSGLHFADLTNPQTYNLYTFVVNDPNKYFDAHGLSAEDEDGDDDWDDGESNKADEPNPDGGGGGGSCGGLGQVPCPKTVDCDSDPLACGLPPNPSPPNPVDPPTGGNDPGDPDPGDPDPSDPDPSNPDPGNPDPGNPDPGDGYPGYGYPGYGYPGYGGPADLCGGVPCTSPEPLAPPTDPRLSQALPFPTQQDKTKALVSGLNGPNPQLVAGDVGYQTTWIPFHLNSGTLGTPLSVAPYTNNPKDDQNTIVTIWQKNVTGTWYWDGNGVGHGTDHIATGNSALTGAVDQIWGINGVQVPILMGRDANGKSIFAWVIHVDRSGRRPIYSIVVPFP